MSFETECADKVRHLERQSAKRATKQHPGQHMSAYRCRHCGFWHIGHWRPGVRRP